MTEITPLLKQQCDVPHQNIDSKTEAEVIEENKEEEPSAYEAASEIPMFEIVTALFSEWRRNGANEDLTPQDIMAMHIQYRRVTHGREVLHSRHIILNELADAMLSYMRKSRFYNSDPCTLEFRHKILRNLQENWSSIIKFDETLAQNLNVYHPPTSREQIQNAWTTFQKNYTALQFSFSDFTCQILLAIIFLSWTLSMLIMGAMFTSHCPIDGFLSNAMVAVGVVGISAALLRLALLSVEKWYWFPMRTVISSLWYALKFVEFVFFLALTVQLWLFIEDYASSNFKILKSCNETFYSFMFHMNYISTSIALVWIVTYFVKAVLWIKRIRYRYRPPFYVYTEMNIMC